MQLNDNPIKLRRDDFLNRQPLARTIAEEIEALDASQGLTVAITGPWGSGKTSLVNLVKEYLGAKVTVFDFNPWFFSGASDLLGQFFSEFAQALEPNASRLDRVASALRDYGRSLTSLRAVPIVGGYADAAGALLDGAATAFGGAPKSLNDQKHTVEDALREQDRRFLVFIDDLDRLDSAEVQVILKLVRLVGNLPKVVYILAYDQERIEAALDSGGFSGSEYLEKVVFSTYNVPRINKSQIRTVFVDGLNEILRSFNISLPDGRDRQDRVMHQVLLSIITTLRNAKRFLVSCRAVCRELHADVDVLDLLCLEALRLFKPAAYRRLAEHSYAVSWTANDHSIFNQPRFDLSRRAIGEILGADSSESVVWILKNLFPFAWRHYEDYSVPDSNVVRFLHDKRVGNRDVFTKYLDRYDEPGIIATRRVNELLSLPAERDAIYEFWRGLHLNEAADVTELLSETTQDIGDEMVILLCIPLIHLSALSPVDPRRFWDTGVEEPTRLFLARQLAHRSEVGRTAIAWSIYKELEDFEARFRLITILQMQDDDGTPLIGTDGIMQFMERLAVDFSKAEPTVLARERYLLYLSTKLIQHSERFAELLPDFSASPELAWSFLRSSINESFPDRHGKMMLTFDLQAAENTLGSRERVLELIEICKRHPRANQGDEEILEAAFRTLSRLGGADFGGDLTIEN